MYGKKKWAQGLLRNYRVKISINRSQYQYQVDMSLIIKSDVNLMCRAQYRNG